MNFQPKAFQQLSSGKAPGADAIPAEVYKAGDAHGRETVELFHCMWRNDASIIHVYKSVTTPEANHRGISLISIAGKVLAKIMLNRLNVHLDQTGLIPESQCVFRKDRGTIDITARQLQENTGRLSTSPKLLTQLVVVDSGKSWPSLAVHPDS